MSKSQALAIVLTRPEEWPDGQARILDTDLAALAGVGQPRDIRKVIKGYEESGDLGQVSQRAIVARYENRPGIWQEREVIAYYLDEEQALFVLAKLETPPAKAVTRGVIAAFVAMRRGEASLAVVAPANDTSATLASILKSLDMSARQTERFLAGINLMSEQMGTMNSKVHAVASEVGAIKQEVRSEIGALKIEVNEAKTMMAGMRNSERIEFHDRTKRRYREAIFHCYGGLCPCCEQAKVLESSRGQVYGAYDHWEGHRRVGVDEGWLVCVDCNKKLGPAGHDLPQRRAYHWRFEEFCKRRRAYEDRQLSLLPGGQDGR